MYVLGTDVGTTGTKTVVLGEDGGLHGSAYCDYPTVSAPGGISEQSADDWYEAVIRTVREATRGIDSRQIAAIALSTQGATTVAVDGDFTPLRPAITWMDMRSEKQCARLDRILGEDGIYLRTGWTTDAGSDAAKLLWLRENEPDTFNNAHSFVSTIEFINYKLTGQSVVDPTNASIREMFNISTGKWDGDILRAVGITEDRLPRVLPSGAYIGRLTDEAARQLGLSFETALYNGAHDQYCASIGCGATKKGDMLLSTGTAWVLLGIDDTLRFNKSHIVPGIHPIKGLYGNIASLGGVGSAMKWLRDNFGEDYKTLDAQAAGRMKTAQSILFYPYFSGASFPHDDRMLSGTVTGLRLGSDKYDLARALMEGVAFEVRGALEKYRDEGMKIDSLKIMGGASRSDVWCEIVGGVTGCGITRMENAEACALGAARIGAVGCGMLADLKGAAHGAVMKQADAYTREHYNAKYEKYRELGQAIKGVADRW